MTDDPIKDYWEALERLKKGKPINVKPGGRITNDAVSIEAGRGRGSIKKSRPIFTKLIAAIEHTVAEQTKPSLDDKRKLEKQRSIAKQYRKLYEEAIARELSLLREVYDLKQELAKLKSRQFSPIRS